MEYTTEAIQNRIKSHLQNPVNHMEGGFCMDNIQAVSQELAQLFYMEILPIPDRYSLETAEGFYLDLKGKDLAEPRKEGEDDTPYRKRLLEKIQRPITSGNPNHYVYWAKQVGGVGNAKCIDCWAGGGTVKIIVLPDHAETPTEDVLQAVRAHIEKNRPAGAKVTVAAAVPHMISIDAVLELALGYDIALVREAVTKAVSEYLTGIAYTDNLNLSYYRIGELMFHIEGIAGVIDYTVNSAKDSISAAVEEYFKLEEVVIHAAP